MTASLQTAAESAERLREGLRQTPHDFEELLKSSSIGSSSTSPGSWPDLVVLLSFWGLARLACRIVNRLAERAQLRSGGARAARCR